MTTFAAETARTGPMTFGQLSVWRDVEVLPEKEAGRANLLQVAPIDGEVPLPALRAAVAGLRARHEALRTTYDLTDPTAPRQVVHPPDTPGGELGEAHVAPGECAADFAARLGAELKGQPFDLTREQSWRAVAVLDRGRVSHLVLVVHHIAADAHALTLLGRDFVALLRGDRLVPAGSPLALAETQRSDRWLNQRESAARHLREVFTLAARAPAPVMDVAASPDATMKIALRSRPALGAAMATAAELKVPMPSVLLAAFCHAVHDFTGVDDLMISAMCANRQYPGTADLVSSMNQWAPLVSRRRAGQAYDQFVQQVHWANLRSYRHGCYDVDVRARTDRDVRATVGPIAPEFFFNYTEVDGANGPMAAENGPGPEWSVERQDVRYFGAPDFYLQIVRRAAHLEIVARTRWNRLEAPMLEAFLTGMHELVLNR